MDIIIFFSAIGLLILIVLVRMTFKVVPNQHVFIKERLGRYNASLGAGFHFLIPLVDRLAYHHLLKEQVIDVPSQVCITKDNVQVEVDGILYIRVLDPHKASYGISNYHFASSQLSQTSMRSEIGKLDLDQTFIEREQINDAVVKSVDEASDPWGIKVTRYEIKNIIPTKTTLQSMEQQMKAEREKRSDILHSEGERASVINRSEGQKRRAVNMSEGEKTRRINEAEGNAEQIRLVAEATAEALKVVASAIESPGGRQAVQLRITQEYIKNFGQVIRKSQTTVVPLGVAAIQGAFEGFSKVADSIKGGNIAGTSEDA